ncbi:uncharacterized protein PITG_01593 [Phytophthora infestans T30-4]|uniref:Uncharacterized protein n=1 Tax=Phytophthora infestans (strain T30-4) TaxID=403677 RepID=D0MTL6_PHYIT|nr:uncharacterized protein PITG_01593 [Phytophthora infestans T30-4]EEY61313.1 hypothetical protein PITG_01593 [Phytophthora infestans T30-4]|eukprot:XP_002908230.1 hypothetical protein PITG_01593 [Phytophthora infestans T30-4]
MLGKLLSSRHSDLQLQYDKSNPFPPVPDWKSTFPAGKSNGTTWRELHRCKVGRDRPSGASWGHAKTTSDKCDITHSILKKNVTAARKGIPREVARRPAYHKKPPMQHVRQEFLILPASLPKSSKRKRKSSGGRILTVKLLEEDEASNKKKKRAPTGANRETAVLPAIETQHAMSALLAVEPATETHPMLAVIEMHPVRV